MFCLRIDVRAEGDESNGVCKVDSSQGYEPNSFCAEFLVEMSGTAQQSEVPGDIPIPGGEDVSGVETRKPTLPLADLTNIWTLSVGSDSSLGRPEEWNGESNGFDDFAFKFANWLSGLPGHAEKAPGRVCAHGMSDRVGNAGTTREGRGKR